MAGIFSRLFKIGQAEVHSAMDKMEDPIKMTEQGIRDLKEDLTEAMKSLAQVKSLAINMRKQGEDALKASADYERKAMQLLDRAQKGQIDPAEAERLATEALNLKKQNDERALSLRQDYQAQQNMANQLQAKVSKLQSQITSYENELVTLKARAKTASSMKKINRQLANVDSSSTLSMLEKMKQRVNEEESLAQAYGEISSSTGSLDARIDDALAAPAPTAGSDDLLELKRKMGLLPSQETQMLTDK